jgi:hypothetical protein
MKRGALGMLSVQGALGIALLTVAFGVYSGEKEWVYDDRQNYRDNPRVASLSGSNVQWAFESGVVVGVYEPVANVFKMGIFSIFGFAHRTTLSVNWALHMLNTYLSFQTTNLLVGRVLGVGQVQSLRGPISIGTILMGVHPLRVEVVAWASCLPYTLAAFFALSLCIIHLNCCTPLFDHSPPTSASPSGTQLVVTIVGSCLLFAGAVYSKVVVATLVLFLIWCDALVYVRTRVETKKATGSKTSKKGSEEMKRPHGARVGKGSSSIFAFIAIYYTLLLSIGVVAASITHRHTTPHDEVELIAPPAGLATRISRASSAVLFYLLKTCCPPPLSGLSVHYLPTADTGEDRGAVPALASSVIVAVVAVLTVSATALFLRAAFLARAPSLVASSSTAAPTKLALPPLTPLAFPFLWLGYGVLLLPTLGLVGEHTSWIVAADRYCYIPSLLLGPSAVVVLIIRGGVCVLPASAGAGASASAGASTAAKSSTKKKGAKAADGAGDDSSTSTIAIGMGVILASALALSSQQQSRVWASEEQLWRHAISMGPADSTAQV